MTSESRARTGKNPADPSVFTRLVQGHRRSGPSANVIVVAATDARAQDIAAKTGADESFVLDDFIAATKAGELQLARKDLVLADLTGATPEQSKAMFSVEKSGSSWAVDEAASVAESSFPSASDLSRPVLIQYVPQSLAEFGRQQSVRDGEMGL